MTSKNWLDCGGDPAHVIWFDLICALWALLFNFNLATFYLNLLGRYADSSWGLKPKQGLHYPPEPCHCKHCLDVIKTNKICKYPASNPRPDSTDSSSYRWNHATCISVCTTTNTVTQSRGSANDERASRPYVARLPGPATLAPLRHGSLCPVSGDFPQRTHVSNRVLVSISDSKSARYLHDEYRFFTLATAHYWSTGKLVFE